MGRMVHSQDPYNGCPVVVFWAITPFIGGDSVMGFATTYHGKLNGRYNPVRSRLPCENGRSSNIASWHSSVGRAVAL